jgi:hypothetical protein
MRKLVLLFAIAFWAFTISLMLSEDANAQKKGDSVTQINTASPVFYFIYEGEEGDGAVELQIHDRKHQFVSMSYDRLNDQAKGNDPKNPLIKLINIPEVGGLAFRQVETLEEAKLAVDGINVLSVRLNKLKEAARIIYQ